MKDFESVKILSEEKYWERMHRLRCLSLYRQEAVMVSNTMPQKEALTLYLEIVSIGNRALNAIERHRGVGQQTKQEAATEATEIVIGYKYQLPEIKPAEA